MPKDVQSAAEIEKKKAKSDAKKHRKLNAILDRRMVVEEPAAPLEVEKDSKNSKKSKKSKTSAEAIIVESPPPKAKRESKRPAPDAPAEEPKAKKSKKSKKSKSEDVEKIEGPVATTSKPEKKKKKDHGSESIVEAAFEPKIDEETARKEKKRLKREKKRQEEAAKVSVAATGGETSSKKRKRPRDQDEEVEAPAEKEKSHNKKVKAAKPPANGQPNAAAADQWNPDALTGDEARKAKFLRLLGAGKSNGAISDAVTHKPSAKVADISKVQSELERQYEMGMKMKHDGGGKRRGLGA